MEKRYITLAAIITIFWAMFLFSWGFAAVSVLLIVFATLLVWKFVGWKAAFPVALTFLVILVFSFYYDPSYAVTFGTFVASLSALVPYYERSRLKKVINLLLTNTGMSVDSIEVIPRTPTVYDLHTHSIFGNAVPVKIWSQKKAYKGLFDTDNNIMHWRERILFPLYSDDVKPLWKEVTRTYEDGTPKQVEFRDSFEVLHGVDYLDQEGVRTERSWRRHFNVVERWNPKRKAWEPPHE